MLTLPFLAIFFVRGYLGHIAVTRRPQSWVDGKSQAQEPCVNRAVLKFPHLMRYQVTASSKSESLQVSQAKRAALCPPASTSWVHAAQKEDNDGCLEMPTSMAC